MTIERFGYWMRYLSGTAGRWDWELFASWTLNRFTITHNGTLVNINMSPGAQHTLAMEITDIGGGQVQSRFCIDGSQVEGLTQTLTR